jgi:hypothetical protein
MPFFYANDQQKPTGPVTREQLDQLAVQGKIVPGTLVVEQGASAWVEYRTLAPLVPPATRPITSRVVAPPASVASVPAAQVPSGDFLVSVQLAITAPRELGQRLIALGGLAAVVAFFIPWLSFSIPKMIGSSSRMTYSGWNAAVDSSGSPLLFVVPALAIWSVVIAARIHDASNLYAIHWARVPLVGGTVLATLTAVALPTANMLEGIIPGVSVGLGLWLTGMAGAAQAIGGWMVIGRRAI